MKSVASGDVEKIKYNSNNYLSGRIEGATNKHIEKSRSMPLSIQEPQSEQEHDSQLDKVLKGA